MQDTPVIYEQCLAWLQFDPQFIFWSPEFSGECAVSSVPAIHNIIRHSVDDCTVIVIVSRKKKEEKRSLMWSHEHSAATCF